MQYNGRNYTITEISQYEYREEKKERVTDKRKKNYGKYIGTGEYEYYVGSCLTECEYSSLRGDYIYSNNFAIECVVIPDTVKVISSNAFWACVKLKNINIPEGVEVLGRSAFGSCEKLQEITLPSTIKRIEKNCFRNTNTVVTIKNEEGVVDIGEGAFGPGNSVKYVGKPEKKETPQPKQSVKEKKEPKATTKTATAKKEITAKSKSKDSSVKYGKYEITINEDKSVSVTLKGNLCDNSKKALREVSEHVGFEIEDKWTTRQLGAKLVAFLNEKK